MIWRIVYVIGLGLAGPVLAMDGPPSGLPVTLHETIYEPQGVTAASAKVMRLRYVAPAIVDRDVYSLEVIEGDFEWFCTRDGLKNRFEAAPQVEQIIVSVASEIVIFGETAPNVVQYFDAFRIEGNSCIWEGL